MRIGRYLRQFVITREDKVQNVVNTESSGIGIRVIAKGTWGFAASSDMSPDSVAKAAKEAVAIAKANSRIQAKPVELAPVKGVGEVSWSTPIVKNSMEVPLTAQKRRVNINKIYFVFKPLLFQVMHAAKVITMKKHVPVQKILIICQKLFN